ncbi:Uncharacterized protein GBIM_18845 [Gryllus bimaculatus]|nr:Uncharacterized protein GBIM_18845 [Gryllus bimaculatus]
MAVAYRKTGVAFQPEFAEPIVNLTVPVGRDATFTCIVHHLGGYRCGQGQATKESGGDGGGSDGGGGGEAAMAGVEAELKKVRTEADAGATDGTMMRRWSRDPGFEDSKTAEAILQSLFPRNV